MKGTCWRAAAAAAVLATAITASALAAVHGTTYKVPGTGDLVSVGCPTTGSCVAVGETSPNKENQTTGAYVLASDSKVGTPHAVAGTTVLTRVACPKAGVCIAVGDHSDASGSQAVYVEITNGKPGTVKPFTGMNEVASIGCGSQSSCWAPGADCTSNGATCKPAVAHIMNGAVEKVYAQTGSYDFSAGETGGPTPACSSATSCTLAGTASIEKGPGLIFSLTDGKVKILDHVSATTSLSGLDCTSKSYCTLVGVKSSPSSSTGEVLTLSSGKVGPAKPVKVNLFPLACQSAGACFSFGTKETGTCTPQSCPAENVVVPIDKGKPGSPEKITPNIGGATCTAKSCLGVGSEGRYPSQEGVVFSF